MAGQSCLTIGAGPEQVGGILKAQALGYKVVALDGNHDAPGLALADVGIATDIRDEATAVQLARAHQILFTVPVPLGRLLTTQGAVNDALGLRGISHRAALRCTNKELFHNTLADAGVALPRQCAYETIEALAGADGAAWPYPVVLKPTFGSGSRGVVVLANCDVWQSLKPELAGKGYYTHGAVVESFVAGMALGIDAGIVNGALALTLVREKEMTPFPHRVELAYLAPASLPSGATAVIHATVLRAVRALEIDNCVLHADAIWTQAGELVLIELSARSSGLGISRQLVPSCTGVDFLTEAIRLQAIGAGQFEPLYARPTLLHFWHHDGGRVMRAPSEGQLRELPNVVACEQRLNPGRVLVTPANASEMLPNGYLLVTADSWAEVVDTRQRALSLFEFEPL